MYNIFISHSWTYSDEYKKLIAMLNSVPNFYFKDYSVPKNSPIHNVSSQLQLRAAIRTQMAPTNCILILAGMYSTYSKWINIEIDLAKNGFIYPKKIIAIEPWGAERTSELVKNAANETVKWQSSSIVTAIRNI